MRFADFGPKRPTLFTKASTPALDAQAQQCMLTKNKNNILIFFIEYFLITEIQHLMGVFNTRFKRI